MSDLKSPIKKRKQEFCFLFLLMIFATAYFFVDDFRNGLFFLLMIFCNGFLVQYSRNGFLSSIAATDFFPVLSRRLRVVFL